MGRRNLGLGLGNLGKRQTRAPGEPRVDFTISDGEETCSSGSLGFRST